VGTQQGFLPFGGYQMGIGEFSKRGKRWKKVLLGGNFWRKGRSGKWATWAIPLWGKAIHKLFCRAKWVGHPPLIGGAGFFKVWCWRERHQDTTHCDYCFGDYPTHRRMMPAGETIFPGPTNSKVRHPHSAYTMGSETFAYKRECWFSHPKRYSRDETSRGGR